MPATFVPNGNQSISLVPKPAPLEVRDLDWFKKQLQNVGVGSLHIAMDAQEHFNAVPPELLEFYIPHRRHFMHRDALLKAEEEMRQRG